MEIEEPKSEKFATVRLEPNLLNDLIDKLDPSEHISNKLKRPSKSDDVRTASDTLLPILTTFLNDIDDPNDTKSKVDNDCPIENLLLIDRAEPR
jgi:hypothetical protein